MSNRIARCKFTCLAVEARPEGYSGVNVTLTTQYDPNAEADKHFTQYTPSGSMEFVLDNPALEGFFVPGQSYFIDITSPVDPA